MRTSTEQPPSSSRPRPTGFKLGPLPTPTFSQAPTPTSAPTSYSPSPYLTHQQELQLRQQQLIQQATRGSIPQHLLNAGPVSPRLIPLGSPGPVTPLTLEESTGGYLLASATHIHQAQLQLQAADLEKLAAAAAARKE